LKDEARLPSQNLVKKGIGVNGVAPGPIWTPLIPAPFDEKRTSESSYFIGQILHPNGGTNINA